MSDTPTIGTAVVHRRSGSSGNCHTGMAMSRPGGHHNRRVAAAQRRREPTWPEFGREIGIRLQRARERAGLSQERTAHLAGIASYTYQKFEKGESRPGAPLNPRLSTLLALCRVLDLRLEDLVPEPAPAAPLEH
jgi:DNA-binding XRE family transcriptional regulator